MCRWMAWLGQPVLVEELLFNTEHGIVDQSLHSRLGAEPTNGDGFGFGWYGSGVGSTDTEVVFYLALTLGLQEDPLGALERTVGVIESIAARHGIEDAVQATFGVSDGTTLWGVRYATTGPARSLFASANVDAVRRLHPDNPRFQRLSPNDRLIVSEPFSDLPGIWDEIPPSTSVTVRSGGVLEQQPFRPRVPQFATMADA